MKYLEIENIIFEYILSRLLKKWIKKDFIPNNYKYFLQSDEINDWGEKANSYFMRLNELKSTGRATREEILELESFDYYLGNIGKKMNNLLRGIGSRIDNDLFGDKIKIISKTLDKFESEENVVVLRLVEADFIKNCVKNTEYVELGFLSTSLNLSHRKNTDGSNELLQNKALFILKVPSRTNALYVEYAPKLNRRNEYELLIQKGKRIRLEKTYKIFSNKIILGKVI